MNGEGLMNHLLFCYLQHARQSAGYSLVWQD